MFTTENSEVKTNITMPAIPSQVFILLSVERALRGATIRALGPTGDKVGAGYINSVRERNGARFVSIRLTINGLLYVGSLNWDHTRFCQLSLTGSDLEASV